MTTQTTTTTQLRDFLAPLGRRIAASIDVVIKSSPRYRRAQEAQRYFAMSDEELGRRGLKRDDIVRHVFGPSLYL